MDFFTSDTHFNQKNIVERLSNWDHAKGHLRDFKDQWHMNDIIIENINQYVGKHDTLYHLGDFCFSKDEKDFIELMKRINCENVHLVYGNHDHVIKKSKKVQSLFKSVSSKIEKSFSIPPVEGDPNRVPWEKQFIVLDHYAHRVWNKSHHGSWMLYGHSHAGLDDMSRYDKNDFRRKMMEFYSNSNTVDVGIDNIFRLYGEYRPISIIELRDLFKTKSNLLVDHHEKRH